MHEGDTTLSYAYEYIVISFKNIINLNRFYWKRALVMNVLTTMECSPYTGHSSA